MLADLVNMLYPKWDELQQPQRAAQQQYITDYLDTMSSVLNSANFADPVEGYAKYIDVDAAIDHHILNVLAFNVDALRLSAYFFKPRDGQATFGPLWDFDRALGPPTVATATRASGARPARITAPICSIPIHLFQPWFSRMFLDPDFWQRWIDRWQELRRGAFALTNLQGLVDSLANQAREAEKRQIARWPGFTTPRGGSYQAEVDRMKNVAFQPGGLHRYQLPRGAGFECSCGAMGAGTVVSIAGPAGATIYYTVDGSDPRARGGDINPAALIYSGPITVCAEHAPS